MYRYLLNIDIHIIHITTSLLLLYCYLPVVLNADDDIFVVNDVHDLGSYLNFTLLIYTHSITILSRCLENFEKTIRTHLPAKRVGPASWQLYFSEKFIQNFEMEQFIGT
uniref:Uncharacterized protein n=1 Tax=Glossina austeni TaxID=7395 RepID=A0A1A9V3S4_GLOAU